ncbi:type II toxin-antitoxin system VapC family toxin [Halorubrum sp. BOL3-1]|uniref:type II toxin-antitoxin system VapC family toxin n=1 Tax=Halorubrum sp. BOL3-1 TaxID=2497325 RepID=UPI0010050489|nr:type II toxin-antitoxin system VapC family toxin [Halorubrum sp. BOL3-1]QAU13976.1 type II toxin-antitoxin system VapC family toxin [Halorubrum sp. BOL3-1]
MILDSSFLIDLMNADEDAITVANDLESTDEPQRVPAQVVYELYVGVGYTEQTHDEVGKIQSVLNSRPIVPLTDEIARHAGRIDGQLRREGDRVGQGDIKIAATALRHDEPVVTGNPKDFNRISELIVRDY